MTQENHFNSAKKKSKLLKLLTLVLGKADINNQGVIYQAWFKLVKFNGKKIISIALTCLVILSFIFLSPIYPKEINVLFDNKSFSISYFEDKSGAIKFNEIRNKKFKDIDLIKTFFSGSTFWFKITLNKFLYGLEEDLFLNLEKPTLDHITFYKFEKGEWFKTFTGDSRSFNSRETKDRDFVFKLKRDKTLKDYYVKVNSTSFFLFPINVFSKKELEKKRSYDVLFYGFFYFTCFFSFSFVLFLSFFSNLRGIFLYIFLKIFLIYLSLVLSGFGSKIIYSNFPFFQNELFNYAIIFYFFIFISFSKNYFEGRLSHDLNYYLHDKFFLITSALLTINVFLGNKWWFFPYFLIPSLFYYSYLILNYIKKFRRKVEGKLLISSVGFLYGTFFIHLFWSIGILRDLYIFKNIIFLGLLTNIFFLLAFVFFSLRKKIIEKEVRAVDLIKTKDALLKKADDLGSFSSILMKNVEDLEGALKELEDANKIKTTFISNISHEIKTPLNAIIGFSEILKTAYHSEAQRDYLQSISESGIELSQTLDKIIDISKIEAGDIIIRKAPLEIKYLENLILKGYSELCEEKGIDFKFNSERKLMDSIEVDPFRFEELIHSLIDNAIKFTEKGKVEVFLEFKKEGDYATFIFEVKDTGVGISSDNLKKVFKPFFKIENIIMGDSGLGLGLSLVDAIVTQMRGSIDIMSEEGSGTKVKVKIPNIRIIEGLKNNENTTYKQFNGEIVAIIDENKFSKDHLRSVLENFNLKVVTFSSIEEFSGYISFSEANLVLIQRELSSYTQFVHLKMFPLKEVPTLKILLNQTKLEDSIYTYDDPLNIYMKVFNNIKTSMEKFRFKPLEKLEVKNIEELIKKIDLIQIDYQRLKDLMEINQIEEFASKIKKMSEEHNVSELENWADELIIKTTNFEIDSIEDLLDKYLIIIKELKK